MGMHSYELMHDGSVIPRHDLGLKEVRAEGYFPSVTTKLKLPSVAFLDTWRQKKAIDYTRQNPQMTNESLEDYYDRIDRLIWQPRERWDGEMFESNAFGTFCHEQVEEWHRDPHFEFDPNWEMYVHNWPNEFSQIWKPHEESTCLEPEVMVACPTLKTAGTVDLLAEDHAGRLALGDFKFRPHKGKPYQQVRDKDCQQLAIEADIIRRERGLGYFPDCFSAVGCVETGAFYVKKWSPKMVQKHLHIAWTVNMTYDIMNGFRSIEDAHDAMGQLLHWDYFS